MLQGNSDIRHWKLILSLKKFIAGEVLSEKTLFINPLHCTSQTNINKQESSKNNIKRICETKETPFHKK